MRLLAIDTSSAAQVVALGLDDRMIDRTELVGREHSQKILPAIEALLADAGVELASLTAIAFGQGPGSFTGLRIGVGVVQGLAYGASLPVVPVSTLAVLAQAEYKRSGAEAVAVALHARKDEVFFGAYTPVDGVMSLVGREGVHAVSEVPAFDVASCVGVGDGWQFARELEAAISCKVANIELECLPEARALIELGEYNFIHGRITDALSARPEYLREEVAAVPLSQQP